MQTAKATAHSNIALVKYWGKRPGHDLNLPAVGSLSMTLDELRTVTRIAPAGQDRFELDGERIEGEPAAKVFRHLDRIWRAGGSAGNRPPALVDSTNHLPTAAGLASSASGFCALTLAAATAYGWSPEGRVLSQMARRGSGSAARSLWGGYVRLHRGDRDDGEDCYAEPLFSAQHWDLRLLVVHTTRGAKAVGSTGGMERCRQTSPYYGPWVDTSESDLAAATDALASQNLAQLGEVVEHSCFKMHASMLATRPPLMYWNGTTLEVIREVWAARADGLEGYVTSDAGPHVKVLCRPQTAAALGARLAAVPGVHEVQSVAPGPDATVVVEGETSQR